MKILAILSIAIFLQSCKTGDFRLKYLDKDISKEILEEYANPTKPEHILKEKIHVMMKPKSDQSTSKEMAKEKENKMIRQGVVDDETSSIFPFLHESKKLEHYGDAFYAGKVSSGPFWHTKVSTKFSNKGALENYREVGNYLVSIPLLPANRFTSVMHKSYNKKDDGFESESLHFLFGFLGYYEDSKGDYRTTFLWITF